MGMGGNAVMLRKTLVLMVPLLGGSVLPVSGQTIHLTQDERGRVVITNQKRSPLGQHGTLSFLSGSLSAAPPAGRSRVQPPPQIGAWLKEEARQRGVDEQLVLAVARAESGFNPRAVSPKGAVGVMQLMEDTARMYGVTDRFDAQANIRAGVAHLRYLLDQYSGDWDRTLAAYNAGQEAVRRHGGIPPYRETRAYVRTILAWMGRSCAHIPAPGIRSGRSGGGRSTIYTYTTPDGRLVISDRPQGAEG